MTALAKCVSDGAGELAGDKDFHAPPRMHSEEKGRGKRQRAAAKRAGRCRSECWVQPCRPPTPAFALAMQCVVISHGEGWVYASPLQPGASLLTRQRPGSGLRSLLAALKGSAGRALLRLCARGGSGCASGRSTPRLLQGVAGAIRAGAFLLSTPPLNVATARAPGQRRMSTPGRRCAAVIGQSRTTRDHSRRTAPCRRSATGRRAGGWRQGCPCQAAFFFERMRRACSAYILTAENPFGSVVRPDPMSVTACGLRSQRLAITHIGMPLSRKSWMSCCQVMSIATMMHGEPYRVKRLDDAVRRVDSGRRRRTIATNTNPRIARGLCDARTLGGGLAPDCCGVHCSTQDPLRKASRR
ncbi:MAG: hypothetical protein AELANPGJ_02044 [Anaerolineae bacterium]|nr:hypothetical protein [Anaerolineae bacterium]